MRTDTAQSIRLKDYRPPDWLVETVSLDVTLHPTAARIRATLALKPNPQSASAPLILNGDGLSLISLKLDGTVMAPDSMLQRRRASPLRSRRTGRSTWKSRPLLIPPPTLLSGLYRLK
jgi:aminopeptidase N